MKCDGLEAFTHLPYARPWSQEAIEHHVRSQVETSSVTAVNGKEIELPIGDNEVSLCCHSDSPGCLDIVQQVRKIVDDFNKKF